MNRTVCGGSGRDLLTYEQLVNIRAALAGKPVSREGVVDHTAPEVTPWLKLFVVTCVHLRARTSPFYSDVPLMLSRTQLPSYLFCSVILFEFALTQSYFVLLSSLR